MLEWVEVEVVGWGRPPCVIPAAIKPKVLAEALPSLRGVSHVPAQEDQCLLRLGSKQMWVVSAHSRTDYAPILCS